MSTKIQDQARFTEEDCAAVVMASFACRMCLAAPELITLAGQPGERRATCRCPQCGTLNQVTMSDEQAFQLWTLQRGNTFVHFAPEYW
jgi:phage FluMu protein Com